MQPRYGPSSQANPINPVIPIQWSTRLCSKKNWREPSALNLWNPVTSVPSIWFLWKSKDFLVTREQKVRCYVPPGSARARPWSIQSWNTTPSGGTSPLTYYQEVSSPTQVFRQRASSAFVHWQTSMLLAHLKESSPHRQLQLFLCSATADT